jgi:hypothetical protein
MPTYKFSGMVIPPSANFTLAGSINADWNDPATSLAMKGTLTINGGVVEVVCDSNLPSTDQNDGRVHFHALNLAISVVSICAFGKGMGLSVVIETVIRPDGIKYNIQQRKAHLEPLVTALQSGPDGAVGIASVLPFVLNDPTIFIALTDLISSVNFTADAAVKCGRAIESIRHYMAPQNDRSAGWSAMRDNLNFSRTFLEFITENSKGPRHGDVTNTPVSVIDETIRRSWIVMNRFLEFKKRGDQQLPLVEFPLL